MASWRLEMRLHASVSPVFLCRTSHTVSADSAVVWLSSRTKSYSTHASCAAPPLGKRPPAIVRSAGGCEGDYRWVKSLPAPNINLSSGRTPHLKTTSRTHMRTEKHRCAKHAHWCDYSSAPTITARQHRAPNY